MSARSRAREASSSLRRKFEEVVGARHDRHEHHRVDQRLDPGGVGVGGRDQGEHRGHLDDRLQLAERAGRDHHALLAGRDPQAADRELARDDHHRHPARHPVEADQRDQRGRDHQLVRHRVHHLAERGDRLPRAGDVAVQPVRERGDREHDRGDRRAARRLDRERHDQNRHQQDADQRERVREVEREHAAVQATPSPASAGEVLDARRAAHGPERRHGRREQRPREGPAPAAVGHQQAEHDPADAVRPAERALGATRRARRSPRRAAR